MNDMTLVKKIAVAIFMMAPAMGCAMAETEKSSSTEYYQSFAGYNLPLKPVQKISKEEAEAAKTYCVAYFDGGRMVRLVKMLDGSVFFEHTYAYYRDGKLMRAEVKNRDGAIKMHEFDASGALKK